MKRIIYILIFFLSISNLYSFDIVAKSKKNQWTGVAIDKDKNIFVNYPYWSENPTISVEKIDKNGKKTAFPNKEWNNRNNKNSFQAIQSVFVDNKNVLWVLETNNPLFNGVIKEGPILYSFNPKNGELIKKFNFSKNSYQKNSYFNDVRIDTEKNIAYITDSGVGGIIILNLTNGKSRRLLEGAKFVKAEVDHLICDGHFWKNSVDSDGIALTPDNKWLYFIALTGRSLYKISTNDLLNENLTKKELLKKVLFVSHVPATDGIIFDKDYNLWLGGLENNSINLLDKNGNLYQVLKNKKIRWADSFAIGLDNNIYFSTSQIHLKEDLRKDYYIIKLNYKNIKKLKIK